VLNSQRERVIMGNNNTLLYLLKSFSNNCKVCYRFVHHAYLHRLIHTELPNKIMQDHSFPVFLEFVKLELAHYQEIALF
jgi:hypothetical protein